ncbi:MAG: KOW motif-containing protein [Myxococcales bacterium]|nr:KOW motif-containing protein [Myxococcales bacterium]
MSSQFAGFQEAEFEVYAPPMSGSNAATLTRMRVADKCVAVAKEAAAAALAEGLSLELRASDVALSVWNKRCVSAQWVFLWRDAAARKVLEELLDAGRTLAATLSDPTPFYRHAFLALHLTPEAVSVGLNVHGDAWVDVKHLRAVAADAAASATLLAALRALPEGFTVGVTGHAEAAVTGLDLAGLRASVAALTQNDQWWSVRFTVSKAEAVGAGALLAEALEGGLAALLAVYRQVAWRPDNDLAHLDAELAKVHRDRAALDADFAARTQAWEQAREADLARAREAAQERAQERVAAAAPARFAVMREVVRDRAEVERPAKAEKPRVSPPRPERRAAPTVAEAPAAAPKPSPSAAPQGVSLGARVRVNEGPFAGRVGTVAELDARVVKVSFGLLSARVDRGAVSPAED